MSYSKHNTLDELDDVLDDDTITVLSLIFDGENDPLPYHRITGDQPADDEGLTASHTEPTATDNTRNRQTSDSAQRTARSTGREAIKATPERPQTGKRASQLLKAATEWLGMPYPGAEQAATAVAKVADNIHANRPPAKTPRAATSLYDASETGMYIPPDSKGYHDGIARLVRKEATPSEETPQSEDEAEPAVDTPPEPQANPVVETQPTERDGSWTPSRRTVAVTSLVAAAGILVPSIANAATTPPDPLMALKAGASTNGTIPEGVVKAMAAYEKQQEAETKAAKTAKTASTHADANVSLAAKASVPVWQQPHVEAKTSATKAPEFIQPSAAAKDAFMKATGITSEKEYERIVTAYNYLITDGGLSAVAASGGIGNLTHESGVNPHSVQGGSPSNTVPSYIANKLGYGIAQWTTASRQDGLVHYAHKHNESEGALQTQLEYIGYELHHGYKRVLNDLKDAKTPEEAAIIWMGQNHSGPNDSGGYENPRTNTDHHAARARDARRVYQLFNGQVSSSPTAKPAPQPATHVPKEQPEQLAPHTAKPAQSTPPAQLTRFGDPDSVTAYKQEYKENGDGSWGEYGSYTVNGQEYHVSISRSGCGPTEMATILSTLTGDRITPEQVAHVAADHGQLLYNHARPGGGFSSWDIGKVVTTAYRNKGYDVHSQFLGGIAKQVDAAEAHHRHPSKEVLNEGIQNVNEALEAGALVIAAGNGELPFTGGGHFIVIRAAKIVDGKVVGWYVSDSDAKGAHKHDEEKLFSPMALAKEMHWWSVYAISSNTPPKTHSPNNPAPTKPAPAPEGPGQDVSPNPSTPGIHVPPAQAPSQPKAPDPGDNVSINPRDPGIYIPKPAQTPGTDPGQDVARSPGDPGLQVPHTTPPSEQNPTDPGLQPPTDDLKPGQIPMAPGQQPPTDDLQPGQIPMTPDQQPPAQPPVGQNPQNPDQFPQNNPWSTPPQPGYSSQQTPDNPGNQNPQLPPGLAPATQPVYNT